MIFFFFLNSVFFYKVIKEWNVLPGTAHTPTNDWVNLLKCVETIFWDVYTLTVATLQWIFIYFWRIFCYTFLTRNTSMGWISCENCNARAWRKNVTRSVKWHKSCTAGNAYKSPKHREDILVMIMHILITIGRVEHNEKDSPKGSAGIGPRSIPSAVRRLCSAPQWEHIKESRSSWSKHDSPRTVACNVTRLSAARDT